MPATRTPAASIHTRAIDAIPGYSDTRAALDHARTWFTQNALPGDRLDLRRDLARELRAAALAGKPLPDVADRLEAFDLEARRAGETADLIRGTIDTLTADLERVLAAGEDDALDVLRTELDDIITTVRASPAAYRNHTTADAAIAAGTEEQWRTVADTIRRYDQLRGAHTTIVRTVNPALDAHRIATAGQLSDAIDHDPHWQARRAAALSGDQAALLANEEHRTWLHATRPAHTPTARRATVWGDDNHAAWLAHIATNATPFIATADDIITRYDLMTAATVTPTDAYTIRAATNAREQLANL